MPEGINPTRDYSLAETLERIRSERYPHLDRDLVLEILRLHADPAATPPNLARAVDEAIGQRLKETV